MISVFIPWACMYICRRMHVVRMCKPRMVGRGREDERMSNGKYSTVFLCVGGYW